MDEEHSTTGTLADTSVENDSYKRGFLYFWQLVGTIYYKKYPTGFDTQSPATHYLKFNNECLTENQQHCAWLDDIRQNIWDCINFESEMVPSDDSLFLHC